MSSVNLKVLGAVSPYTTKDDSCPGYLLTIDNNKILLDCGSGVCKNFNFPNDLNNLTIIISHLHKDHYSDLLIIAYASYVYNKLCILKEKIKVLIPKVDKDDNSYSDYVMIKNMKEHYFDIIEYDENSKLEVEKYKIEFFQTYHSVKTLAVRISKENFSFVYGADMGFEKINEFCEFAYNSKLIILESSFLNNIEKNSEFHLSSSEAALIAKLSNTRKLLLTHFWPEHDKKLYLKESKNIFKNTIIAKAGMIIQLNK